MMILALLLQAASAPECGDGADVEIAQCWSGAFDHADTQLNKIWPDVRRAAQEADKAFVPTQRLARPSAEADLLAAQRAWLKYRDAQCALESDYAQGGSLQNIISGQCATELTRKRAAQLRDIAAGFREG